MRSLGVDRASRWRLTVDTFRANLAQVHRGYTQLGNRVLGVKPVEVRLAFAPEAAFAYRPGTTDLLVLRQIFLEHEYSMHALRGLDAEYVVDLGSNIGVTALYWANLYPKATLVLVEPDPANIEMLRRNVARLPNPVHVVHAAIADRTGTIEFHVSDRPWAHSTHPISRTRPVKTIEVPAITMNDLIDRCRLPRLDLVKMDIEGAETVVMPSMSGWKHRPRALYAELHDPYSFECFERDCRGVGMRAFAPNGGDPAQRQPYAIAEAEIGSVRTV